MAGAEGGGGLRGGEVVADHTPVAAEGTAVVMVLKQRGRREADGRRGAFAADGGGLAHGFAGAEGEETEEVDHGKKGGRW